MVFASESPAKNSAANKKCPPNVESSRLHLHNDLHRTPLATSESNSQGPIFWDRLRALFQRDEREDEPWRDRPRRREVAVVVCLLISCLLWFTFTLQEQYTVTFELPTRVANVPEGQALTSLPPEEVAVQVQGQGINLLRLRFSTVPLVIDASRERQDLSNAVQALPGDLTVQSVSPRILELEKEPQVTRRVPVRLRARIETPPTHDLLAPPDIQPDSVTVAGARSIVNELTYWPTDTLVVEGLRDSLVTRIALADTLSGLVSRGTDRVLVQVEAQQFTEGTRELDVLVQGSPDRAVTLEPSVIQVRYRVPISQYAQAEHAAGFFATVSYDEIRADTNGFVRPQLHVPDDLEIRDVRVSPPRLRYYNFIDNE